MLQTVTHSSALRVRIITLISFVLLATAGLPAHDLWIEPSTFSPERGTIVGVGLRVGQDFLGDPVPRDPALIDRFVAIDGDGPKPLVGRDGADPAGFFRAADRGLLVLGYLSKPYPIVLAAGKFNQYLADEGLDAVAALRKQRGETNADAREVFSRCAKSLLQLGAPSAADSDRVLGFPLELVAERNPYTLNAGRDLPVRLVYRNEPLEGALVVAIRKGDASTKLSARSARDGRVMFRLDRPGTWLIKAVHMIPAPAGIDAQWASLWASLTFELPQP